MSPPGLSSSRTSKGRTPRPFAIADTGDSGSSASASKSAGQPLRVPGRIGPVETVRVAQGPPVLSGRTLAGHLGRPAPRRRSSAAIRTRHASTHLAHSLSLSTRVISDLIPQRHGRHVVGPASARGVVSGPPPPGSAKTPAPASAGPPARMRLGRPRAASRPRRSHEEQDVGRGASVIPDLDRVLRPEPRRRRFEAASPFSRLVAPSHRTRLARSPRPTTPTTSPRSRPPRPNVARPGRRSGSARGLSALAQRSHGSFAQELPRASPPAPTLERPRPSAHRLRVPGTVAQRHPRHGLRPITERVLVLASAAAPPAAATARTLRSHAPPPQSK